MATSHGRKLNGKMSVNRLALHHYLHQEKERYFHLEVKYLPSLLNMVQPVISPRAQIPPIARQFGHHKVIKLHGFLIKMKKVTV